VKADPVDMFAARTLAIISPTEPGNNNSLVA
jgi:hypothetical protein